MSHISEYLIEKEGRIEYLGHQLRVCYAALCNELPTETALACLAPLLDELHGYIRDLARFYGPEYSVREVESRVLGEELADAVRR